ncbi:MAG: hypothetical protein L0Y45_03995 [Woeseiaceae bacterium]|nr:hypothetical protein [Woeseiaceae bacterium]
MITGQPISGDDEIDAAVRGGYRAIAREKVPAYLDRMVLEEAGQEISRDRRVAGWPRWLLPAAFAGVLALSLSFNLGYNNSSDAPAIHGGHGVESDDIASIPMGGTADLETAVESTGRRLRALDDAVSGLAPGNNPGISAAGDVAPVGRFCSIEATTSADTWWTCIETLQRTGQADAARAEIELLEASFPESLPVH